MNPENTNSAKYKTKFKPHLSKLDTTDFNRNFVDEGLKLDHDYKQLQNEEENQGLGIKSKQVNGKSDLHTVDSNKTREYCCKEKEFLGALIFWVICCQ